MSFSKRQTEFWFDDQRHACSDVKGSSTVELFGQLLVFECLWRIHSLSFQESSRVVLHTVVSRRGVDSHDRVGKARFQHDWVARAGLSAPLKIQLWYQPLSMTESSTKNDPQKNDLQKKWPPKKWPPKKWPPKKWPPKNDHQKNDHQKNDHQKNDLPKNDHQHDQKAKNMTQKTKNITKNDKHDHQENWWRKMTNKWPTNISKTVTEKRKLTNFWEQEVERPRLRKGYLKDTHYVQRHTHTKRVDTKNKGKRGKKFDRNGLLRRIKVVLESFEDHAQEAWEVNWMNLEKQTTLLNRYLPKLIATILKALREKLKENDQLHSVEEIATPVPEIPLQYDQILIGGGKTLGWWQRWENCPKILCWPRDVNGWIHSGVYKSVPLQECRDAGMKPLDLIWVDRQVCGSNTREISIEVVCERMQDEESGKDLTSSISFSTVLCNATSRCCDDACFHHDVSELV